MWFLFSVILLLTPFFRATSSDYIPVEVHCPANRTSITLLYDLFESFVELKNEPLKESENEIKIPQTLSDLTGFDAELYKEFFTQCPMSYTLKKVSILYDYELIKEMSTYDFDFVVINTLVPIVYSPVHVTQPAVILPSSIVYLRDDVPDASFNLLLKYGLVYAVTLTIGSVVVVIIAYLENQSKDSRRRYFGGVLWNFVVTPFGLCNDRLTTAPSMKVFNLFWFVVWFLMAGYFWAEMSSGMTVDKLRDEINTLEDVLKSDRKFFWKRDMQIMTPQIIGQLRRKYEKHMACS